MYFSLSVDFNPFRFTLRTCLMHVCGTIASLADSPHYGAIHPNSRAYV